MGNAKAYPNAYEYYNYKELRKDLTTVEKVNNNLVLEEALAGFSMKHKKIAVDENAGTRISDSLNILVNLSNCKSICII